MDPHDPRVNPGISPSQVSMDTSLWWTAFSLSRQPYDPPRLDGIEDNWPAQLALVTKNLQVRIMSVEGLKKTPWEDSSWLQGLARLESALQPGGTVATPDLLPLAGFEDSRICYWGKEEKFESKSWQGLRWISLYEQGCAGDEWSSPLGINYVFEGISRDGRYFILMFADIADLHPPLKWKMMLDQFAKLYYSKPVPRERFQTVEEAEKVQEERVRDVANRHFDEAPPDSFKPDLRQLDAAVRSIELR